MHKHKNSLTAQGLTIIPHSYWLQTFLLFDEMGSLWGGEETNLGLFLCQQREEKNGIVYALVRPSLFERDRN